MGASDVAWYDNDMSRLLAAVLGLAIILGSALASAQQDPRALFREGQVAYETGDYATAARLWEEAYALDARPALQYNLAQAYERLGELARAADAYRRFIENAPPDSAEVPTARARLVSLEQRLDATAIVLAGGPEGATVLIDGEDRGRLPRPDPFRTTPGPHRVVVSAEGYDDFVANVVVSAGQSATVTIEMAPRAAGESGGGGGGISTVGIIVTSVGGAMVIAGAITGVVALSTAQSAPSDVGPEADQARALAITTDVLLPVGAVAAATGVVLMFVLGGEGGGERETAAVVPSLGPEHAGLVVWGSF